MNNTTRNWKTTLTGAAIIGGYLLNAIATYLKTGAFPDMTEASLALTAGWGFIMAKDASTTGVIRVLLLAPACLMLASCGTMPDGTKTFLGVTGAQGLGILTNLAKREALPVFSEAQRARAANIDMTSGK